MPTKSASNYWFYSHTSIYLCSNSLCMYGWMVNMIRWMDVGLKWESTTPNAWLQFSYCAMGERSTVLHWTIHSSISRTIHSHPCLEWEGWMNEVGGTWGSLKWVLHRSISSSPSFCAAFILNYSIGKTSTHTYTHILIYMYICIYICTHIYTHIYIYI